MRRTGIDVIGDVPWGTHFCQFYESSQDLIDVLVPYFKEGLAANEFCMWITSEPLKVDQAVTALKQEVPDLDDYITKGQIEILDYSQWYTRSGKFSADEVLQGWVDKLDAAQKRGYEGLRLTGNTFWLEKSDWDDFTRYEETINNVIGQYPMLAICTYSLQKCNAVELLDVIANHQFALIKRSGRWEVIERSQHKKMGRALQEANEELEVTTEELRQQNDELIRAQSEILESSERYRELVLNANSVILKYGLDGKISFFNEYAQRFFGYSEKEILGKDVMILVPKIQSNGKMLETLAKDILEHPEGFEENINENILKTGERVWISWRNKAIKDSDGKVIGNLAIGHDITSRLMAEKEIQNLLETVQQEKDRLLALINSINDEIWFADTQKRFTLANPSALREFGLGIDAKVDVKEFATSLEVYRPDGSPRPVDEAPPLRALQGEVIRNQEEMIRTPATGELQYRQVSAAPVRNASGEIIGSVSVVRDITDRKQSEKALLESRQQYATTLASIGDAVISTDIEGKINFMNGVAENLTGWGLDQALMKPANQVFKIINENTRQTVENPIIKVLKIGSIVGLANHTILIRKDGTEVPIDDSGAPIKDQNGNTTGVVLVFRDITERRRIEEKAREQAKMLDLAHILVTDMESKIIFWNKGAEDLYGFAEEEAVGTISHDLLKTRFPKPREEIEAELLREGYWEGELIHIKHDGTPMTVASHWALYRDNQGKPISIIEVNNDITDRRRAEEALRETRDYLENLFGYANAPIIVWDPGFRITRFNHAFERLTGHDAEKVIGEPLDILFPGDSKEESLGFIRRALSGERWETVEIPILRADGSIRTVLWNSANVYREDGVTIIATIAQGQDITERQQAEKAVRKSEERYRSLFNSMTEGFALHEIICDKNGEPTDYRFLDINPAFERLTGLRRDEVIGKTHNEILANDDPVWVNAYGKVALTGEPIQFDNYSPALGRHYEVFAYSPAPSQFAVLFMDITERKKMEGELRKSRDELEQRVHERTLELQNAKEAAETAAEAKVAFLANMSHELRTPMNAVIGFTSLLLDDDLNAEQKEFIEGIREGGEAMMALISDILDFSRADKGKVELEHQPLSLKHLIEEALDMVAVEADHKGLNLAQTISYRTPDTIVGDHGRLRQILVNLLSNAVKFTDEGEISLSISSKTLDGNKRQIHFSVKDTGIGMPQDKMSQIFEPFTQLERTISCQRDGAGLGLAISQKLVELMGGDIWAESVPGQGTTFHFTIPAETIPDKNMSGETSEAASVQSLSELKPLRILVADDNPSNQRVLVEMLKRLGYRADAVADGIEVLQALERQPYDLVLMDIRMPEMDGITATHVIRKLQPRGDPKIVAITAYALEGDKERCLEAGMDDYISKPVKMEELEAVLVKYSV